jgi:hypothetical protein
MINIIEDACTACRPRGLCRGYPGLSQIPLQANTSQAAELDAVLKLIRLISTPGMIDIDMRFWFETEF